MTNSTTHPIDARDLTSRLTSLETNNDNNNNNSTSNNTINHGRPMQRRARSTSPSTRSSLSLSYLPRFSKSSTISTVDSGMRGSPHVLTFRESVEVGPGAFSKPRVHPRSRRYSGREEQEEKVYPEFRPYGRHSNQWLFNDFSITGAVGKGFKKVFGGSAKEGKGDWFEDREK